MFGDLMRQPNVIEYSVRMGVKAKEKSVESGSRTKYQDRDLMGPCICLFHEIHARAFILVLKIQILPWEEIKSMLLEKLNKEQNNSQTRDLDVGVEIRVGQLTYIPVWNQRQNKSLFWYFVLFCSNFYLPSFWKLGWSFILWRILQCIYIRHTTEEASLRW